MTRCAFIPLLTAAGLACLPIAATCAQMAPAQQPAPPAPAAATQPDDDPAADLPPELRGLELVEKLDQPLPLELEFIDHNGKLVKLGDYFDGTRPVILTLNYYRCPMLCGLQLNGMVDALDELDWTAGDNFRIVTVSFDPLETRELAYAKRQTYLKFYGRPEAAAGWDFLVGNKRAIDALLDATGFPVRWNERRQEWIHPAVLIVATPEGHISRYLRGVAFEPKTVRLSLVEASQGKIGSTVDQILLFCFHYDAAEGRYAVAAMNLVRAGGVLTAIVLGGFLFVLWRRERHRQAAGHPPTRPATEANT